MAAKLNRTEAYVVLNLLPRMGPRRLGKLLEAFGVPEDALAAGVDDLARVPGISREMAYSITQWERQVDLGEELRLARELGVEIVTRDDPFYPPMLREIYDPPILLYTLGRLSERERHCLGIVGSRKITSYGQDCARQFGYSLAKAGFTVVSGLALGIDTEAHKAALAAGGRTVAVIGSGLGHIYPPENKELARRIAEGGGAVISEFPIRQRPEKTTFPLRNRVISGMSEGLLVVEAGQRSGALITASQAVEQNRAVFAIPGRVDSAASTGCNRLIQEGARLVLEPGDILDDLANFLDDEGRPKANLRKVPGYPINARRARDARSAGQIPEASRLPPQPLPDDADSEPEPKPARQDDLFSTPPIPIPAYTVPTPEPPEAAPERSRRRSSRQEPSGPITVRPMPELEAREALVLDLLSADPATADSLIEKSGLTSGQLTATLMALEMKHLARQLPGRMYARR